MKAGRKAGAPRKAGKGAGGRTDCGGLSPSACRRLLAHASEILDGEASASLTERARRHLAVCRSCTREVKGLKAVIEDCHKLKDGRPGRACREKFRAVFERWKSGKKPCQA